MKTCTKCGEVKALDAFHKNSKTKDGHNYKCKPCAISVASAWAKANPEKRAINDAAYRARHGDKENERKRSYCAQNKDKVSASNKKWRDLNPERCRARSVAWAQTNSEKITAYQKSYRDALKKNYIAASLKIKVSELSPELYELKREQLETRRLAKQLKQATKEEHASI